ncbi:hypothetical protein GW17_00035352, partial [Ensete ventricosum]
FYFDFHYTCDAPADVSQQWYQSQGGGWAASHGHASCKGDRLWSRPPTKGRLAAAKAPAQGTIGCGHGRLQRDARGKAVGPAPARGQAARVNCLRRGHKGSAHPRPACRGVVPDACAGATVVATAALREEEEL